MATIELTKANLQSTIDENDIVLIDFWADWCGPCKAFGPVFEKASEQHTDVAFAKCDTKAEPEVAAAFDVQSIPTLAVFRDKVLLFLQPGALPPQALEELIAKIKELDMEEVRATISEQAAEAPAPAGADPQPPAPQERRAPEPGPAPVPPVPPAGAAAGAAAGTQPGDGKVVATTHTGDGLAHLADDFVLRRQGVTREYLDQVRDQGGKGLEVLAMYDRVRSETREHGVEGRERMRPVLDEWGFDPERDLADLDAETRSEIKAILRALDELMAE